MAASRVAALMTRAPGMKAALAKVEVREVMDIRQASNYLGISGDTLYKYASEGSIPAFKLGNRWRFKKSRVDEWMDQQSSASMASPESKVAHARADLPVRQRKPVRSAR